MKKLIVGVAAALSVTTSNAIADGPYKRPPPTIAAPKYEAPPPPSWTGFYFGAGIGAGAVLHDFDVNRWHYDEWRRHSHSVGDDIFFGTVTMGYDWQHSHIVFGVFADYDFSDTSTSWDDGWLRRSLSLDNTWSVGGRLGFLSSPATLWYVSGGYTEGEFSSSSRGKLSGHRFSSFDDTLSGYFVGLGVDTRLHSNWFLRLEYRFTQFDSENFEVNSWVNHDLEPSLHTARLTLTYKFTHGLGWGSWGSWGKW